MVRSMLFIVAPFHGQARHVIAFFSCMHACFGTAVMFTAVLHILTGKDNAGGGLTDGAMTTCTI